MRKIVTGLVYFFMIICFVLSLSSCEENKRKKESTNELYTNNEISKDNEKSKDNEESKGIVSTGLLFELDEDNPYYIVTGIGKCTDSKVIVPAEYDGLPVKEIGSRAFQDCTSFSEMVLPNSIIRIQSRAFDDCDSLQKITLSDTLQTIGAYAFAGTGLKTIALPDSLREIAECAFLSCRNLEEVKIPANIKYIRNSCFSCCESLSSVILPEGLLTIEAGAFNECVALTEIVLPDSLQKLNGFYGTSLQSIVIPKNVMVVHSSTFKNSNDLMTIYNYSSKSLAHLKENLNSSCVILDMN